MSSAPGSGGKIARALGGMALQGLRDALSRNPQSTALDPGGVRGEIDERPEPPVVAQLMIEIRSDGSHTIARGALHDLRSQESAHVHAEGQTPAQLIASLLGSLLSLPSGTFQKLRTEPELKGEKRPEPLPLRKTEP
jgi:hypothetical protein